VGCGSRPTGDVNVDCFVRGWNNQEGDQKQGEFLNPRLIPNFIVAHAEYLPFKDGCFEVVFSSHTIEHVKDPLRMLKELFRVSKRQVTVRCPHKKGSGAKRPFHVNYFDEEWFQTSLAKAGFRGKVLVSNSECLITSRLLLHSVVHCPKNILPYVETSLVYRIIRKLERSQGRLRFPFEIEVQGTK
jgi:SAM-dependent methyltransferase